MASSRKGWESSKQGSEGARSARYSLLKQYTKNPTRDAYIIDGIYIYR